jgi:hypothetical protein
MLACGLGRDLDDAKVFLDALVAIGVLERGEDGYVASPAMRQYLESLPDC